MYAVGRLGSYITRGVYTVSGPFHPFGGAVDIIVVEQQDGSFKSSPWYVKFGKFQGVLKAKEKIVNINVNGDQADFHMYLDHKGEAFFLREEDVEEGDSAVIYPSSSGEDTDGQSSSERRPIKSKTYNFDAGQSDSVTQIDVGNGKILTRTNSSRSRIMGLVFGRKSMKENGIREGQGSSDVVRVESLERAEIAADLLEMRWSTNLASRRHRKDNSSQFATDSSGGKANKDFPIDDAQGKIESTLHNNNIVNSLNHPVLHNLHEEIDNHDNGMGTSPRFGFQKPESFDKDVGVEMSCLNTKHIIGTSNLGEIGFQEKDGLNSETLREIEEFAVVHAGRNENAIVFISELITPDPVSDDMDLCQSKMLKEEEQEFKEDILLADNCVSKEESGADGVKEFVVIETLDSSRVGLDDSGGQTDEALYLSCGGSAEDPVHSLSEVTSEQETSLLVAKEPLDAQIHGNDGTSADSCVNSIVTEMYTQKVSVDPENGSVKEVESRNTCTISGFNNSCHEIQDGENTRDENNMSKIPHSSKPVGDYQGFRGDSVSTGAITVSPSESSEEQLLFGDFDDFSHGEANCVQSISSNQGEKENLSSVTPKGSEAVIESLNPNDESHSSSNNFVQENTPDDVEDFRQKSRIVSRLIDIPRSNKVVPEDVGRISESLPNIWSPLNEMVVDDLHSLGRSLDSNSKSSNWDPLQEDVSSGIKSDEDKEVKVFNAQPTVEKAQISEEFGNGPAKLAVGDPSKVIGASNEGWGGWPSLFKRSRSMKTTHPAPNSTRSSDAEKVLDSSTSMDGEKDLLTPKVKKKKKVRAITPTPEQLASLNLKEGKNTVTFTFSTAMLGPQQVDARIYLWKWDSRVVISDVDGTITKSDVLGQFMPLVGRDWSQTGVAHLFSAIKENGYQLLFLSARAISQAYNTRQFLFNLKQDGKALPEGPVVISPDGLFPSLFREVIRRAPHEFKIACLEDIRALFPSDRKPFYAGFGNRDTDEYSYLQVGIPKGKIFIINPKGEVAVNRRVDTKSYTSLHTLVHDMFPPMSSSEQEDFNSWNFWKLPNPSIDN